MGTRFFLGVMKIVLEWVVMVVQPDTLKTTELDNKWINFVYMNYINFFKSMQSLQSASSDLNMNWEARISRILKNILTIKDRDQNIWRQWRNSEQTEVIQSPRKLQILVITILGSHESYSSYETRVAYHTKEKAKEQEISQNNFFI